MASLRAPIHDPAASLDDVKAQSGASTVMVPAIFRGHCLSKDVSAGTP